MINKCKDDNVFFRAFISQPAISIGNVGQLAVDLLINSIADIHHCGYIDDENVLPVIGSDPFAKDDSQQGSLSTNFEGW